MTVTSLASHEHSAMQRSDEFIEFVKNIKLNNMFSLIRHKEVTNLGKTKTQQQTNVQNGSISCKSYSFIIFFCTRSIKIFTFK